MKRTELEIEIDLLQDILVDLNSVVVDLTKKGEVKVAGGVSTAWLRVYDLYQERQKTYVEEHEND